MNWFAASAVVIAIDAVPYGVFARLQGQGLFREFFPAARMVSPFPSLTNVGYASILRTVRGPGSGNSSYSHSTAPKRNERFRPLYPGSQTGPPRLNPNRS